MNMPPDVVRYGFPTDIYFGTRSRLMLPHVLRTARAKRPLIVTDRTLVEGPLARDLFALLQKEGFATALFGNTGGNPVKADVTAGAKAITQHESDAVVALGGGAALDVGKAVALMAHHPGDLFDYAFDAPIPRPIGGPMPFIAALPTTAGTGSEVGRSTVVSDDTSHAKRVIFSPRLMPQAVFADPELTLGLPPAITAATGMDALTHLLESYLSKGNHPMCDGIALEGLRLVHRSLVSCYELADSRAGATPAHLQARGDMLHAALMGAVAFQKGLGVTHSAAHALSTVCDLHHGLANSLMLPACMAFNLERVPQRFSDIARTLELSRGADVLSWLNDLQRALRMPHSLREVGVKREQIPELVRAAMHDGCHQENPAPVTEHDFELLFTKAWG